MNLVDIGYYAAQNAWIIPALPLFAFMLIVVGKNVNAYENRLFSSLFTIFATFLGFLLSTVILLWSLQNHQGTYEQNFVWLEAGSLRLSVGWLIDSLSAVMLLVVTSISLLIQIYSHGYMNHDEGYNRFFAYLALFNFSMLGLVLSTNLFQMYIFWELVGVSSYLLIGFWFKRDSAAKAATKAFLMNRVGDFGFLCGIMGILYFSYNFWLNHPYPFLSFAHLEQAAVIVQGEAGRWIFLLICIGIFLGTMAKSAQVPLHTWLPDAMEGPTPISALIHAATMVAAGVYLVARVYPLYTASPDMMTIITWVGLITAFIAATIALTQTDIKKALAYSTCSQLGYMVMAMGLGAYSAGIFHLVTHAYFKALLFLCSGAVIHALLDQQNMFYMGGLKKSLPVIRWTYLIGTIAITGILPFSGFFSKDMILTAALEKHAVIFTLALFIAGLTAFYMFRTYFLTFEGTYRGTVDHPHNPAKALWVPLVCLAVPSALLGFVISGDFGMPAFSNFIFFGTEAHPHTFNYLVAGLSFGTALIGMLTAYYMYIVNQKAPHKVVTTFQPFYTFLTKKWYFDELYNTFIDNFFLAFSKCAAAFDTYIIDGLVNLAGSSSMWAGNALKYTQNGKIQLSLAIVTVMFMVIGFMVYINGLLSI